MLMPRITRPRCGQQYGRHKVYGRPCRCATPHTPSHAPSGTAPYDPETFYECDGGMIPILHRVAPEPAQRSEPHKSSQYTVSDEVISDNALSPGLYSPMHRLERSPQQK